MKSIVTSKYQTTIPKVIREHLGLSVKDTLEWKLEKGKITVSQSNINFLRYRNSIKTDKGNIASDIDIARKLRMDKYR